MRSTLIWGIAVLLVASCGGNDETACQGAACASDEEGPDCIVDDDCEDGFSCREGRCAPPGADCSTDADCGDAELCSVLGVCIDVGGCRTNDDCLNGSVCSSYGKCMVEGSCLSDGDCGAGLTCSDINTCAPNLECGGGQVSLRAGRPAALIALDRSCSMTDRAAGVRKWDSAIDGVAALTATNPDIKWGLSLFPDMKVDGDISGLTYYDGWSNAACDMEDVVIPVGEDNGAAINSLLEESRTNEGYYYPNGPCNTPIDTVTLQSFEHLVPLTVAEDRAVASVVLITDGKQVGSCNDGVAGVERHISQLRAAGIRTFVVGFGGSVNESELDRYADLGGTARAAANKFYKADTAGELDAMLKEIGSDLSSCEYTLDAAPPSDREMFVFFGDQVATEGWIYDAATNAIAFEDAGVDSVCGRIQRGEIEVTVGFDCPITVD